MQCYNGALPHLNLPLSVRVGVAHNNRTVVIPQSTLSQCKWGGHYSSEGQNQQGQAYKSKGNE